MLENPPPNPTATPGPRLLNKREFLADLQCHKQLWWRVHDPDAEELIPDPNTRALMEAGRQVGLLAREYAPGGRLIDFKYQARASRVAATAAAMETEAPALYEGTCTGHGLVVHADILDRGSNGWTLVEVKSSVEVKPRLFDGGLDPEERSVLREQLLAYCKVDTWAMVRLFERLSQLAQGV